MKSLTTEDSLLRATRTFPNVFHMHIHPRVDEYVENVLVTSWKYCNHAKMGGMILSNGDLITIFAIRSYRFSQYKNVKHSPPETDFLRSLWGHRIAENYRLSVGSACVDRHVNIHSQSNVKFISSTFWAVWQSGISFMDGMACQPISNQYSDTAPEFV